MSIEPQDKDKIIGFPGSDAKAELATEAGHWYLYPSGEPYYTVIGSTTGRPRPVTIRDARKVNAVPSVTTMLKCWRSYGLDYWNEENIFNAARQYPNHDFSQVRAMAAKPREKAADRGTALHAAIEKNLLGRTFDPQYQDHITGVHRALLPYDIDLAQGASEKSFAHKLGFGGKVDYHDAGAVIDFKSKAEIKDISKLGYINHYAQLAAYREGLGISNARGLSVFVGVNDCKVVVLEWTQADLKRGWDFFRHLLGAWKIDNKYYPKL